MNVVVLVVERTWIQNNMKFLGIGINGEKYSKIEYRGENESE